MLPVANTRYRCKAATGLGGNIYKGEDHRLCEYFTPFTFWVFRSTVSEPGTLIEPNCRRVTTDYAQLCEVCAILPCPIYRCIQ
jgi:hypothetical protein